MTKVTMRSRTTADGETPSESIVAAANKIVTVTDAKGRTIGIKRMNALDRLRMFEVIGGQNAQNEAYLGYTTLAFHVVEIGGEPVSRPASKLQLEGLIQRLDDDGIEAVALGVGEHFGPAGMVDDLRDAVKNG